MPLSSLLLRLLLSLCLVLNGTAAAAASVQMAMPQQVAVPATQNAVANAAAEEMPCHGHHGMAAMAKQDAATRTAPLPIKPSHSPDCCKAGTCRCACVHIAQLGVPVQIPSAALDHDRSVRPLSLGHAAPALPHPIRPPIG